MGILGLAVLIVLGLLWIGEVLRRFGRDVAELREGDWSSRLAIIVIWIATCGITGGLGWLFWRGAARVLHFF